MAHKYDQNSVMVTMNYQTYGQGFNLRLRLYQDGETRYISVNKLLQGNILKKHWNQKKQCFIPSAPFSESNNSVLVKLKEHYENKSVQWSGSLSGLAHIQEIEKKESGTVPTFFQLIDIIIAEQRKSYHADNTMKDSYEGYKKLGRRIYDFCIYKHLDPNSLSLNDITLDFVNSVFDWIDNTKAGRSYVYVSKMLHATLAKAEKRKWFDMSAVEAARWKNRERTSSQKYNTLSLEQCRKLIGMPLDELPRNQNTELYRDFCTFLLFTGQSPCDAIVLKYSDIRIIDGVEHFTFKRRKISEKQKIPCLVPINPVMKKIMDRWRSVAKDNYIFPIRSNLRLSIQSVNNGDIKHFIGRLNVWLKKVGSLLGCQFPLHTYTFRHTAITNYISKGVPVIYIANMMGTSVDNCEKIYYNNQGDLASRDLVLNAVDL